MNRLVVASLLAVGIGAGCSKSKPIDRDSPSKRSDRDSRRADDDRPTAGNRLEIVEVDDRASLALPEGVSLPEKISLEKETPPSSNAVSVYLERDCEGEMMETCAERLRAFASTLPLPAGGRLAIEVTTRQDGMHARTWVLKGEPVLTDADVASARVEQTDDGMPRVTVQVELYSAGRTRFADFTGTHLGSRIAIVTDGRVQSAPVVQSRIAEGKVQITMGAREVDEQRESAERLVTQLRGY